MAEVKVLYVEDEPFLARIVQESLQSRGFVVKHVDDGALAAETFQEFQPHICVLDVMLPHQDGFAIAREIKAFNTQIPIIFLTAKTQMDDLIHGFEAGGNDYLRKPFSMEELIVRIQNLLKLSGQNALSPKSETEKRHLGSFIFIPQRFELYHHDQVRKLSQRETQLLQMLSAQTEQAVLRKQILLELWGDDSFYNSRNLDVYISRLRDYFSPDPGIRIVTIKGVGYHFRVD